MVVTQSLKYLLIFSFTLVLSNCQTGCDFDEVDLIGNWKVVDWKIEETGQKRNNKMDMIYQSDGGYIIDYGGEKEIGKYWIECQYLHTQENGQAEKKVKLIALTSNTLTIQMNRGGELEEVKLEK